MSCLEVDRNLKMDESRPKRWNLRRSTENTKSMKIIGQIHKASPCLVWTSTNIAKPPNVCQNGRIEEDQPKPLSRWELIDQNHKASSCLVWKPTKISQSAKVGKNGRIEEDQPKVIKSMKTIDQNQKASQCLVWKSAKIAKLTKVGQNRRIEKDQPKSLSRWNPLIKITRPFPILFGSLPKL